MSEILNVLDVNDYGLQSMKASGGGGEVNLQSKEVTITENGTTTIVADTGYDGLSNVDVTVNVNSSYSAKLDVSKTYAYTRGIVSLITEISNDFDTSNMIRLQNMFSGGRNLIKVPVLNMSSIIDDNYALSNVFYECTKLSDESLNNILQSCTTISSDYQGNKTLKQIGLTSAQATTCQTLSNWDAFVAAGWRNTVTKNID